MHPQHPAVKGPLPTRYGIGHTRSRTRSRRKSKSYGILAMMKDVLLVAVFLSLLVMNYLNISILHVNINNADYTNANANTNTNTHHQSGYNKGGTIGKEMHTNNHKNRIIERKQNSNGAETKTKTKTKTETSFGEMLRAKKNATDRKHQNRQSNSNINNNSNSNSNHSTTIKPQTKPARVRQNKIPGSDQSHITTTKDNDNNINFNANNGIQTSHEISNTRLHVPSQQNKPHSNSDKMNTIDTNKNNITSTATATATPWLVHKLDSIYKGGVSKFDSAPIVDEDHKLIFFTVPKVACTTFKFLFRRIAGVKDWDYQDGAQAKNLPHNPKFNNLNYLYHYSLEEANRMMTDPSWTRAIFVRDPKIRFLSAFLDKAVGNYGSFVANVCCPEAKQCQAKHTTTNPDTENTEQQQTMMKMSVLEIIQKCQVTTWDSRRKEMSASWLDDQTCCKDFHECQTKTMSIEGFLETIRTCRNGHWGKLLFVLVCCSTSYKIVLYLTNDVSLNVLQCIVLCFIDRFRITTIMIIII